MSGLLILPTKTNDSMGRVKSTRPDKVGVPVDLDYYETAAEREAQKTAIAAVCEQVGLLDGTTPDSIAEMKTALEAGAYDSILRRIGSAYGSQRIGGGLTAPTSGDDEADGYAPGSWWVRVFGLDNPATLAFYLCTDANAGAAVWLEIKAGVDLSDAAPLASGTASAGVSVDASRSDHVHPPGSQSVAEIAITNGVTLASGDAVALVAGRVTKADGRAGSVVAGYIGQCLTGGTGDVGGTVLARVVVGGLAPASGLTAGSTVYLSTTTIGAVTTTAPSGLGTLSQIVGRALSSTSFALQIDAGTLVDWCSPLDIPTNGIFYGRASSANLLASGRITTNGIADLFGTGRFATVDGSGTAPLYVAEGAPGGLPAWQFIASRVDRLRIAHDAGMTGTAWSVFSAYFNASIALTASLVAKTNGSAAAPFDFIFFSNALALGGEGPSPSVPTIPGWGTSGFDRPASSSGLSNEVWARGARVSATTVNAGAVAGTNDILIGNRSDLGTPFQGFIAATAIWNRQLTAAEQAGLAQWARREWAL